MKESKILWYVLRQILVCFDYCEHIVPRCPSKSRIMQHVFSLSVWWCTMAGLGNFCPKIIRNKKNSEIKIFLTKYSWNMFLKVFLKCENWQICISIMQHVFFFTFSLMVRMSWRSDSSWSLLSSMALTETHKAKTHHVSTHKVEFSACYTKSHSLPSQNFAI